MIRVHIPLMYMNGKWSSSAFEVIDTTNVDIFVDQFFNFDYKMKLFGTEAELVPVAKLMDSLGDNDLYSVDLPGTQDDAIWYGEDDN